VPSERYICNIIGERRKRDIGMKEIKETKKKGVGLRYEITDSPLNLNGILH
jgi:hypothetical protein